jgi:hypothetical protein
MSAVAPSTSAPSRARLGGWLLTGLFLAIAIVIFATVYLAFTGPNGTHYDALLIIGVLAVILALVSYLAESFSRDPTAQRSLAWAFFGMGFATLFLAVGLGPTYGITTMLQALEGLIVVAVFFAVAIALIVWRARALRATENELTARDAWKREPAPSAFSYATANAPSVPSTAPPVAPTAPTTPPPRSP